MYSKTENRVTFYRSDKANTAKTVFGRISVAIKNLEGKYEFENWNVRFMGRAFNKALTFNDNDTIMLKEWAARNYYDKEAKKSYPYLAVYDCEFVGAKVTNNEKNN